MALVWSAGVYNAEGSFNRFFSKYITANGYPAAVPSSVSAVKFDYPTEALTFPCFSVTHLGGDRSNAGEGQIVRGSPATSGYRQHRLTEISCWVSTDRNVSAYQQLRQMRDMVGLMLDQNNAIQLSNLYSGTGANPPSAGIMRLMPFSDMPASDEPNPAIKRWRFIVPWQYLEVFP